MKAVPEDISEIQNSPALFKPKLVMCNFMPEIQKLGDFARQHGFSGIDYSFDLENLPRTPSLESSWVKEIATLGPFEVRYHCPFERVDLGHDDKAKAEEAEALFRRIIRLISKAGGRYVTIHIGLGHDSTEPLSWDSSIDKLRRLVNFGRTMRVKVCQASQFIY